MCQQEEQLSAPPETLEYFLAQASNSLESGKVFRVPAKECNHRLVRAWSL
jgi:hypothetical protein